MKDVWCTYCGAELPDAVVNGGIDVQTTNKGCTMRGSDGLILHECPQEVDA